MSSFEYTDPDGDRLDAIPHRLKDDTPAISLRATQFGDDEPPVEAVLHIPLDRLEEVIAGLRDMARQADGPPEPVVPPWPSRSRWHVETLDPLADEWSSGVALITRTAAVIKLNHLAKIAPTWRHDGSPVRRRIVRETTTYTVEEAGA